jgi:hypothetical protein
MDIWAGGEYKPLKADGSCAMDGDIPNWWGEYVSGDRELFIGNFRQGPEHFYFLYYFHEKGGEVGEGLAVVDGRTGAGGGLSFAISSGNDTVEVALDDAIPLDPENAWMRRFAGTYTRKP